MTSKDSAQQRDRMAQERAQARPSPSDTLRRWRGRTGLVKRNVAQRNGLLQSRSQDVDDVGRGRVGARLHLPALRIPEQ